MSVNDVIQMYRSATHNIFVRQGKSVLGRIMKSFSIYNWCGIMRSQDGLVEELEMIFEDTRLNDIEPSKRNNFCIAAAVASEFNEDPNNPDKLEVFDTKNADQKYQLIREVLQASCDAPVFFVTPVRIGQTNYVDGGLTGNCPLPSVLPRVLEVEKDYKLDTVISIAPPSQKAKKINDWPHRWVGYFPSRLTDGYKNYITSKKAYPNAIFARAIPRSEKAQTFSMDETNVNAMISAIEKERINDPNYYNQILDMAALTVSRLEDVQLDEDFLRMMENLVVDMTSRRQYEIALRVCKNICEKLEGVGNNSAINLSEQQGKSK